MMPVTYFSLLFGWLAGRGSCLSGLGMLFFKVDRNLGA